MSRDPLRRVKLCIRYTFISIKSSMLSSYTIDFLDFHRPTPRHDASWRYSSTNITHLAGAVAMEFAVVPVPRWSWSTWFARTRLSDAGNIQRPGERCTSDLISHCALLGMREELLILKLCGQA